MMSNPSNLTEALHLLSLIEAEISACGERVWDEAAEVLWDRSTAQWRDIWTGRFPIRSPEEASSLLDKLASEADMSSNEVFEGVFQQIKQYIGSLTATPALENVTAA